MSVLEETIRANISALRGGMSSDATPDLELFVPTLRQWLHDECAPTATKLRNALGECDLVVEQVVKYKDSGLDKIADIFRNYEKFVKTECRDIDLIVRRHLGNHLAIILLEFGKPDDALSNIHEIQGLEYLTVSGKDNDGKDILNLQERNLGFSVQDLKLTSINRSCGNNSSNSHHNARASW